MIHENKPSLDDLMHFGVKGMKWGVRNKDTGSGDIVVKKGTNVYNISDKAPRKLEGHIFGAHEKHDVLNYRGNLASSRMMFEGSAYSNKFTVKKNLNVASEKTQVAEFKKMWDTDKDAVVDALAIAQKNMKYGAAIMSTVFKQDRDDIYRQRIAAKGESWVAKKGVREFNTSLGAKTGDVSAEIMRKHYTKLGYDALVDVNDTKHYGSVAPIIYLTPAKSLKSGGTVALTEKDVEAATNAYLYKKARKKYENIDALHE